MQHPKLTLYVLSFSSDLHFSSALILLVWQWEAIQPGESPVLTITKSESFNGDDSKLLEVLANVEQLKENCPVKQKLQEAQLLLDSRTYWRTIKLVSVTSLGLYAIQFFWVEIMNAPKLNPLKRD